MASSCFAAPLAPGFTDKMPRDAREVLKLIGTDEPLKVRGMPRVEAAGLGGSRPRLLAEVEYTEITPDGLIRHPSFKGLREDKPAEEGTLRAKMVNKMITEQLVLSTSRSPDPSRKGAASKLPTAKAPSGSSAG